MVSINRDVSDIFGDIADRWLNNTYNLNLNKDQLMELLKLATTNQLFQLDGTLYEQVEGVAMGSPLGSTNFNVICATRIMSGTQPDTCTNALASINILQLEDTWKTMDKQFSILRKCRSKFDCLIFEMLFIKELKPGLNTQKDSVRAKLFT